MKVAKCSEAPHILWPVILVPIEQNMESVITQVTKESADQTNGNNKASLLRRRFNSPLPPSTSSSSSSEPGNNTTANNKEQGPPGQESNSPPPKATPTKSNFFTKLFKCWCCGRTRRRSERCGAVLNGGADGDHDNDHNSRQLAVPTLYNNGAVGDNQSSSSNHTDTILQHSPPPGGYLLPQLHLDDLTKPCMVIDLDETLVHSSFKPIGNADFIVDVEIDGVIHQVYVAKRPYVDEFLQKMGQLYECILFTASLAKYADPVADLLDKWGVFRSRLFRDACVFHRGNYVKDLNKLGRSLQRVIIVDNSPASYIFHPDNAVPVASWFDDSSDTELLYLIPFFERLSSVENVYTVLRNSNHPFNNTLKDIPVNKETDDDSRSDNSKQFDDKS